MAKLWIGLAACGAAGGTFFLVVGAYYMFSYYMEPGNPIRHEYLQGMAIALLIALPCWIVASGAISPVRTVLRGWIPATIYLITAALILSFVIANVVLLMFAVAGHNT